MGYQANAQRWTTGTASAAAILDAAIADVRDRLPIKSARDVSALERVEELCRNFPAVARPLRHRHEGRTPFKIEDEYDVQDLMHALLRSCFADVRAEEHTPSYAGGSSRVDFLLKQQRLAVEVKKTRDTLKDKKLGEELIIDIARYSNHPAVDTLVCFVFDPGDLLTNRAGLVRDLSRDAGALRVKVIIAPD